MLLKDKYFPFIFDNSSFHKDRITKLKNYATIDNFDNTIIYGPNGNGKYTTALMMLENIYGKEIYNKNLKKIKFNINSYEKEIDIKCSTHHYEIYLNDNNSYDKLIILKLLKQISDNYNISDKYSVILIKNAHYLSETIFLQIKNINEHKYNNCKFILLSNTLINIPKYFFGFFAYIRMPSISNDELSLFFLNIAKKENIEINNEQFNILAIKHNYNINLLFIMFDLFLQKKSYFKYETYLDKQYSIIIKLKEKKDINNISEIKKKLYNLTAFNVNKHNIIKLLFNHFIQKIKDKENFTTLTNNILLKLNKSYRELVHMEYYIISILTFL